MRRALRLGLVTALLALALARTGHAQCTSNSAYVGFQADLTMMEHNLAGTFRIVDDCTFEVTGFSYDGNAPAAWWWGAPSTDNGDIRANGRRIVPDQLQRDYFGETVQFTLDSGLTWDDIPVVLVWCEDFFADFGHVMLQKVREETPAMPTPSPEAPAEQGNPAPSSQVLPPAVEAPAPAPASELLGLAFANCMELLPGYYNLHWEVLDDHIVLGLEGRVGGDNRWMGFGFSAENATDVLMPGSDAVVGGMINSACFAFDYNLQSRDQCSYTEQSGVCPDFALSGDRASNQVELMGCTKAGDVLAIAMMRPLAASDAWDRAWPLDGSAFTVWAMGPVSEGSNATNPVVLYHRLQLPGMATEEIVHAPTGQGYRVNLGASSPPSSCRPLLAAGAAEGVMKPGVPAPAPEASRTPPAVLEGVLTFNFTEGDNFNYPNPPGWGISYHINGFESPVLRLVRGTAYTMNVMAGSQHPLYFTDSIVGGGSYGGFANETIYGGGEDAHGTVEQPYSFSWTPDATTPDLLYYQCTVHQKIGWRMEVVNA